LSSGSNSHDSVTPSNADADAFDLAFLRCPHSANFADVNDNELFALASLAVKMLKDCGAA
jgi:hypothetical protein